MLDLYDDESRDHARYLEAMERLWQSVDRGSVPCYDCGFPAADVQFGLPVCPACAL